MNRVATSAIAVTVALGGVAIAATPAEAATSLKVRALNEAKAQTGDPYKKAAIGPNAFDCSGLTYYSYKRVGKTLQRTAQGQYNKSKHVSASSRQVGDLVFIGNSSGSIYHVGIYAGFSGGYGWMVDSPKPGRKVGKHKIQDYTGGAPKAYYGRY